MSKFSNEKQLNKEELTEDYVYLRYKDSDVCVIIYDRGIIDNKAYLENQVEFDRLLGLYGLSEIEILDSYDLVLDLVTTARCKPSVYVNSEARFESIEEAIEVDKKTTEAWVGHRNLKIINSSISLEEEKNILLEYIKSIINNKQTKKIERIKIDLENSDFSVYDDDNSKLITVEDIYLNMFDTKDYNYIVRKRNYKGVNSYILYVQKEEENGITIIEDKKITEEEYFMFLYKYGVSKREIKEELTFVQNLQLYKICSYQDSIFLEFERNLLNKDFIIPSNLIPIYDKILIKK